MKTCPVCKLEKPFEEYYTYFSKSRQKHRISNYCKECSRETSKERALKGYYKNRTKRLDYAKEYRIKNKEKIKSKQSFYKKKKVDELQNCYLRELLQKRNKVSKEMIELNPEILETKRLLLKINRKLKTLKNK